MERVVQRTLQQWSALYAYFDKVSEDDHSARVARLDQHLKSPLTKLVLFLLEFALESMSKFNTAFQMSLPMLPALKTEVNRLLRILLGRFLKPEVLVRAKDDFTTINLADPSLQLADEDLSIGHKTWAYISEIEDDLDRRAKKIFFNGARAFYTAIVSIVLKKFTFKDKVIDDVFILLPENQTKVTVATVFRLARRFPVAVPEENFDALETEVLDYVLAPSGELPLVQRDAEKPTNSTELCRYWHNVGVMKSLEGTDRFPNLVGLAKCLLSLPHSNADTERVFSIVRKIVTDFRTRLCALVACKLNNDCDCFRLDPHKTLIDQAKGATMKYNKEHSTKHKH